MDSFAKYLFQRCHLIINDPINDKLVYFNKSVECFFQCHIGLPKSKLEKKTYLLSESQMNLGIMEAQIRDRLKPLITIMP